jgi:hypothetical protein
MSTVAKKTVEDAVAHVQAEQQHQAEQITISLEEAQQQRIERALEADAGLDLEENAPQPVKVLCRERRLVDLLDDNGKPVLDDNGKPEQRYEYYARFALIETYVPTELLMQVMLLREKTNEMRQYSEVDGMAFVCEQVLKVWKLSEPNMTLERLKRILDYPKIEGLFGRFFVNLRGKRTTRNG